MKEKGNRNCRFADLAEAVMAQSGPELLPDADPSRPKERPDTALLYSVDDLAALARVNKVVIVRLCLAGVMPKWIEVEGRRYWPRPAAIEAVILARRTTTTRDTRKIA